MKTIPGTSKPKDQKSAAFTKTTSGQPEKKKGKFEVPAGAKNLSHTIRKIHNGYVQTTSYNHKGEYHNHEVYHESDPLDQEGAGEESKNTFGHVKGLE